MRALVCKEYGPIESLVVEDLPSPVAGPGQVVIKVKAASVNYPDALIVQGKYQVRPSLPFTPGAELSGVIKAVGNGVTHLTIGAPVIAFSGVGAFAEEALAHISAVMPLDAHIDPIVAAAVPMTYGTTYHALRDRAQLQSGETLLVLGASGGIGIAAIELGKLLGATVIAAASSPEKLAVAKRCGADHLIDYQRDDLRARLKEITGGRGVDVVCDPVGGSYTEAALRSTAWRGRYLVIGFAAGDIPRIPLNLLLLKGCSLVGAFWGDFMKREPELGASELTQLLNWVHEGKLRPLITGTHTLENAREAIAAVFQRRATGKLLITMS
jgi:NADPH2:quinone reductase